MLVARVRSSERTAPDTREQDKHAATDDESSAEKNATREPHANARSTVWRTARNWQIAPQEIIKSTLEPVGRIAATDERLVVDE